MYIEKQRSFNLFFYFRYLITYKKHNKWRALNNIRNTQKLWKK